MSIVSIHQILLRGCKRWEIFIENGECAKWQIFYVDTVNYDKLNVNNSLDICQCFGFRIKENTPSLTVFVDFKSNEIK